MICQRCLRRLAQRQPTTSTAAPARALLHPRSLSTTTAARQQAQAVSAQTATATNPRPNDLPAATATAAASQPFSAPLTPAAQNQELPIATPQTTDVARVASSVPAGTVLKGLNFLKNSQDPVAREDHEYPAWLWDALNKKDGAASSEEGDGAGDMFSKSKKQRRLAAKALRKQQLLNPELLVPKVPLAEQTIDLPSEDARAAHRARADLTKAMREKRRSKIKEDNFLKEMR